MSDTEVLALFVWSVLLVLAWLIDRLEKRVQVLERCVTPMVARHWIGEAKKQGIVPPPPPVNHANVPKPTNR